MNPFCPKHKKLMHMKQLAVHDPLTGKITGRARFWACPKGCKYKVGAQVVR